MMADAPRLLLCPFTEMPSLKVKLGDPPLHVEALEWKQGLYSVF